MKRGDYEGGNESRERRSRYEEGESSKHHEQSESNNLMDEIERDLESGEKRTTDADELMDDIVRELQGRSETEELMDEIERNLEGEQEARETAEAEQLMDEVKKELEDDRETVESIEDRLDEFEEDILENFEKYGIDGDEVMERWRERFVEDVEEELENDSASDQPDESAEVSDDAADSEMTEAAESYSYSESGDGTVQVLKTEGRSETTESVDESEEHKAEMEPQSEGDSSVESEKDYSVEESNQKEDLEPPETEKQPEKQITHETGSEISENNASHELKRDSKENIPETSEDARARQQTSEVVSESSDEKAEAAEQKEEQAENIETHSARAECEELAEEEVEDIRIEGHLSEPADEEGEVIQDFGSESMQEWTEDSESEELTDSEHLEEPDSTESTSESHQEVLEENISLDAEELDEDEEVDERVASDDEGLTGMLASPYPTVYVDETGFFAETEEQRWRRKLIELYNELPEEMKQLYRELVKAMLESEEGLEKLLDTFSELREYEDFEEEHEDAIKYVKFRQKVRELNLLGTQKETIVKELALELDIDQETAEKWLNDDYDSFPKIIQQVWSQEIQRRWGNVLRAIANRDVPYDMSEVNEILKRFPELRRKRRFGLHYDEVKAWTEVMAAKRQGKIATLIIQGKERFKVDEVTELAKRLNLTVDKVVSWLREESHPRLVDVLIGNRRKLRLNPSEESRSKGRFHNIIDTSKEDLWITETRQLTRKQHLTTDERDRIIRLLNTEHSHRQTDSETDEKNAAEDEEHEVKGQCNVGQPSNYEHKKEVQKTEHEYRRELGKPREVKIYVPQVKGQKIESLAELKKLILEEFPGIQNRDDYDCMVHMAAEHFKLLEALGERRTVKQHEVGRIATMLSIKKSCAVSWTFYGYKPFLYRVLENARPRSEVKQIVAGFRRELNGLGSWDDVQSRLDQIYPNREYENNSRFQLRQGHVIDFFRLLEEIDSGTVKGISARTGIRRRGVHSFMEGSLPYLVRLVIFPSEPTRTKLSVSHRVNIRPPEVHGVRIESIEQLKNIVERDFSGFFHRKKSSRMLRNAEVHLDLFREYHSIEFIPHGLIPILEKRTGISRSNLRKWVLKGGIPQIYNWLNQAQSCMHVMGKLHAALNGVTSMTELNHRLEHLYFSEAIRRLPSYEKEREAAKKFFRFLQTLPHRGFLSDIAHGAQVEKRDILFWFYSSGMPSHVVIASQIPAEIPQRGKKWMPLKTPTRVQLEQFIQVPLKITSPEDILDVLRQIRPLKTPAMEEYELQFGETPRELMFMFLLGILVSDSWFRSGTSRSTHAELSASKKYSWSKDLGRGFCYALGKIGISSKRHKNQVSQRNGKTTVSRRWASEASPFLQWVKRTLLGLKASTPKSWTPIQADWILQMPHDWRVAFLQGIADGDGCATIKGFYAEISTAVNSDFLARILASLGVHASPSPTGARIYGKEDIRRSEELPLFRHAVGRQERLTQLRIMTESAKWRRISERELKIIVDLHRQGFKSGQITEILWNRFGALRQPGTIRETIKRESRKRVKSPD